MKQVLSWQDVSVLKLVLKAEVRRLKKELGDVPLRFKDKNEVYMQKERIAGQLLAYEPTLAKLEAIKETPFVLGE